MTTALTDAGIKVRKPVCCLSVTLDWKFQHHLAIRSNSQQFAQFFIEMHTYEPRGAYSARCAYRAVWCPIIDSITADSLARSSSVAFRCIAFSLAEDRGAAPCTMILCSMRSQGPLRPEAMSTCR